MSDEFARMRERLATRVVASHRIGSERVAAALHAVPRHLFLPEQRPEAAYRDEAIVTKRDEAGQPISSSSQPAIMAIMLDQLDLAPGQRVLEIGAGTGYNAALMSHIVGPSGQVTSVDIDPELVATARGHLARAGFGDVTVVGADGAGGDPEHAPYDRIIATVGVSDLAPAWLAQATPPARIVVPLDVRGTQLSVAFERADPAAARRAVDEPVARAVRVHADARLPGRARTHRDARAGPVPAAARRDAARRDADRRDAGRRDAGRRMLADGPPGVAGEAVAALLAGRSVPHPTGGAGRVGAGALGAGPVAGGPRAPVVPAERGTAVRAARRVRRPADRGAVARPGLALHPRAAGRRRPGDPHLRHAADRSGLLTLGTAGFGPRAAELAADLAAHVQAWSEAGRPGIAGLHVDAYPRAAADQPQPPGDALIMERPGTRFAVYHD